MTPGTLGSATLVLKFLQLSAPLPVSVPLYVKLNTGVTMASMTFTVLSGTTTQNSTSEGTNLTTSATTLPSNGPVKLTATTTGGVSTYNGVRLYTTATKEVITSFFYAQDVPLTFKAASITACGSYNLLDNLTHKFTNELSYEVFNDVGVKQVGTSIAQTGRYKIVAKDNAVPTAAAIESPFINVTINSLPVPSSFTSYYHLPINQAQSFPSITCSGAVPRCGATARGRRLRVYQHRRCLVYIHTQQRLVIVRVPWNALWWLRCMIRSMNVPGPKERMRPFL